MCFSTRCPNVGVRVHRYSCAGVNLEVEVIHAGVAGCSDVTDHFASRDGPAGSLPNALRHAQHVLDRAQQSPDRTASARGDDSLHSVVFRLNARVGASSTSDRKLQ